MGYDKVIEVIETVPMGDINMNLLGINIDSESPSFSFEIISFDGTKYSDIVERGFEYETQEDAFDAAMDFLIDNPSICEIEQKELKMRKAKYFADLIGMLDNPEDNIEEVPEDFRLDMKK